MLTPLLVTVVLAGSAHYDAHSGGVSATDFDTSAELRGILTDETGSGLACFATSPTFTTTIKIVTADTDAADNASGIQLPNAVGMCWEASAAGTDVCMSASAAEVLELTGLTGIGLGAAGVLISDDGDGAFTILGRGDGSDESITCNLDDTANTMVCSSATALTAIDFQVGTDGSPVFRLTSDGTSGPNLVGRTSSGTLGTPAATGTGKLLLSNLGQGHNGTTWASAASVDYITTEVWDGTGYGTEMRFATTAANTTTYAYKWFISDVGDFKAFADNTYDIGASGATRPKDVYVADDVVAGGDLQGANLITTTLEANLTAGACTAGTWKVDTGGAARELCRCNDAGGAYDCIAVTNANGPTD